MWFLWREVKVRVCSSSSVEGGGVDGGEMLGEREDTGLKQRLSWLWL